MLLDRQLTRNTRIEASLPDGLEHRRRATGEDEVHAFELHPLDHRAAPPQAAVVGPDLRLDAADLDDLFRVEDGPTLALAVE